MTPISQSAPATTPGSSPALSSTCWTRSSSTALISIGNSLGGRIALEVGLLHADRVNRLALLAPSLAWRRGRSWAPLVRLTRPELELVQLAPQPIVEAIVRRIIAGADDGWTAAGVDEFLRAYLTPAGRAAFYAAARHIYLEESLGDQGFLDAPS